MADAHAIESGSRRSRVRGRRLLPEAYRAVPAWEAADWPRTSRVMPWLVALFLVMLCVVPFDSIQLSVPLPFDLKLDRLILMPITVLWLVTLLVGRPGPRRTARTGMIGVSLFVWMAVAVASVAVNFGALAPEGELSLALKKILLLVAYIGFFAIVVTVIRPTEVAAFVTLLIGLGCVTAMGTIYEYRTGINLFYQWAESLPGLFIVQVGAVASVYGRPAITGPTQEGLAVTTMLTVIAPFAIQRLLASKDLRRRLIYGAATGILLAGSFATLRRTSGLIPVIALIAMIAYRPREMRRLAPIGLILAVFIQVLAPGALHTVEAQLVGSSSQRTTQYSTDARTADYPAVVPDLKARPILGKGYGTFDPSYGYRILDNQYLLSTVELGFVGVLGYLFVLFAVFRSAHVAIRSTDDRAPPALAVVGAAAAFIVANGLFDMLSFPQAPYLFFFVAGLAVLLAAPQQVEVALPASLGDLPVPDPFGWLAGLRRLLRRAGSAARRVLPGAPRLRVPMPARPQPAWARTEASCRPVSRVLPVALRASGSALVIVALGLVGYLAGRSGRGAPVTTPPPSAVIASSDGIALRAPAGWTRLADPTARIPGLRFVRPIALSAPGGGGLVAGLVSAAAGKELIPTSLRARTSTLPRPQVVGLGDLEGLRYSAMRVDGVSSPLTVFTVATTRGAAVVACDANTAAALHACAAAAATLQVSGLETFAPGPDTVYARRLSSALAALSVARAAERGALRAASTPSGQASAASALASAFARALDELSSGPMSARDTDANRGLTAALRACVTAYQAVARAAHDASPDEFRSASVTTRAAEHSLGVALENLVPLGYTP